MNITPLSTHILVSMFYSSFLLFIFRSKAGLHSRLYFNFYWDASSLWLFPAFIAGGEGMAFQHIYKRWFHIQGTQAPQAWCISSYGPQSSEHTSVVLWKKTLISVQRLAVMLTEKKGCLQIQKGKLCSMFSWYWSDDSFLHPLLRSLYDAGSMGFRSVKIQTQ